MIAALLLSIAQSGDKIELYRGATVPGQDLRYWAVEDTTLNSGEGDRSLGGEYTLSGGHGKTILIKFGEIRSAIGPGRRVVSASLILTPASSAKPVLSGVGALKVGWGEGPMIARGRIPKPGEKLAPVVWAATWRSRHNGPDSIGWQQAGAQGPGDSDSIAAAKLSSFQETVNGVAQTVYRIDGLGAAVQKMADRWYDNQGFALFFDSNTDFASSQSLEGKPILQIETEAAPATSGPDLAVTSVERTSATGGQAPYVAHVKNVGDAPSKGFSAGWIIRDTLGSSIEIPNGLAPGEEKTITTSKDYKPQSDARVHPLVFRIMPSGPDAKADNDASEMFEDGTTVAFKTGDEALAGRLVRFMNHEALPQSRFSFATDGATARVNANFKPDGISVGAGSEIRTADLKKIGLAMGLADLSIFQVKPGDTARMGVKEAQMRGTADRFPGIMGGGDTRFEGLLPALLSIPYEPFFNPILESYPLESTDLFSATDVAGLNGTLGTYLSELPQTMLLKVNDLQGKPIANAELALFQMSHGTFPAVPTLSALTDSAGTALLSAKPGVGSLKLSVFGEIEPGGSNGLFLVRATKNGVAEWGWLKLWQIVDAYNRGNRILAQPEIRLDLPEEPLDLSGNLAKSRSVSDSMNSLPAKLVGLVDDNPETVVPLSDKVGDWTEIDLGRDRPIGEIRLVFGAQRFWQQFDVFVYGTGQKPNDLTPWAREYDWNWTSVNRRDAKPEDNGLASVAYRGGGSRCRYIRLVNRSGGPASLAEIKVIGLKPTAGN